MKKEVKKFRPTVNDLERTSNEIWGSIHLLKDQLDVLTRNPERMSEVQCRTAQVTHSNLVIAYGELRQVISAIRTLIQDND